MGSNSAVGIAVRNELRMGRWKFVLAKFIKAFRSVLEMPPIGFMSAELQSYYIEFRKSALLVWEIGAPILLAFVR